MARTADADRGSLEKGGEEKSPYLPTVADKAGPCLTPSIRLPYPSRVTITFASKTNFRAFLPLIEVFLPYISSTVFKAKSNASSSDIVWPSTNADSKRILPSVSRACTVARWQYRLSIGVRGKSNSP